MEEFSKKTTSGAKAPWVQPLVYLQIAAQIGIAMTPFWATSVQASLNSAASNDPLHSTASQLTRFGQSLQSGNLHALPAQQASGFASQQMEQWLQNFGTARVELGADSRFNAHSGAIDLLLPLSKSPQHLLFSQNGLRQVDGQLTGNIGLGMRHFTEEWMLGYNAFYDQNISRGHKRLGTGVEAWRDYVKLSGNGYWRVSGWREAVDVEDYDARPANGFDVRAEAWLPAYPALGGRLMYEKYYGNEVALFGKDKRQSNPDAVTAGLSWMPIPLISFNTDHKKGGNLSETTFGVQFAWQFGQSLAYQLDSASVSNRRTLASSGMDLVERNNNIVLEYRKQQLIELSLPREINGESGKTVPVALQVQSKYGLAKIHWNDAALAAAGGKVIDQGNGNVQLLLPKYLAGATNRYALSGVAYDARHNASKTATTTVTVNAPSFSLEKSTIISSAATILADGKATANIVMRLVDENNQPLTGLANNLQATVEEKPIAASAQRANALSAPAPAQPAKLSNITEQHDGSYLMVLTAGTRPMEVQVSTQLDGVALPLVSVQQISDAASATLRESDVTILQDNAVANGLAENQLRVRITDATGNPVAGIAVNYALSGSAQIAAGSSLTSVSDKQGFSVVKFTNRTAETVTAEVKTANGSSAQREMHFKVDSENPDAAKSTFSATPLNLIADGSATAMLTLNLKDAGGNAISGQTVAFTSSLSGVQITNTADQGDGNYSAALTSTQAGSAKITVKVNGRTFAVAPVTLNLLADSDNIDASQSTLEAAATSLIANGSATSLVTLHLKDRNANPVSGQSIVFTSSLNGSTINATTDHGDGSYSASLTAIKTGQTTIGVNLAGKTLAVTPVQITLMADSSTANIGGSDVKVNKTTLVANNTDMATYSATVKDAHGNPVANQNVNWSIDLGGTTLSSSSSSSDESGVATINLTGMRAGDAVVTAKLNAGSGVAAKAITFTVPVIQFQNGIELTAAEIIAELQNTEHAEISLYDGHWVGNVNFPPAAALTNRKLTIHHDAVIPTNVIINGVKEVIKDVTFTYTSNGSTWVK